MSDANDWTAVIPASLLKAFGLRDKHIYQAVQLSSSILDCIKLRREKIRLAKPGDAEADEKADEQIFLGAMLLLAAKRGK